MSAYEIGLGVLFVLLVGCTQAMHRSDRRRWWEAASLELQRMADVEDKLAGLANESDECFQHIVMARAARADALRAGAARLEYLEVRGRMVEKKIGERKMP
jgi:hypothetical protein